MSVLVLVMAPPVAARFDAIYDGIGEHLWLAKETYRVDMMNVSLRSVFTPWPTLFSILATGALLQWQQQARSQRWRMMLSGCCVLAFGLVAYQWVHLAAWRPPSSWQVVSDTAVAALQEAREPSGIILTNDLRFQPGDHLPLMNAWAPQMLGQQFYASNFMFGSYAYPDAVERLQKQQWFWSAEAGEAHHRFLLENHIKYLLIRRDMPFSETLLKASWARLVVQNRDYYLLDASQADAVQAAKTAPLAER
jgi:hypothetical protein